MINNFTDTGSVQVTVENPHALPPRLESAATAEQLLRVQSANLYDYNAASKNLYITI